MPTAYFGVAAVGLGAILSFGCVAQRQPLAVVDPEYSYRRDGGLAAIQPRPETAGEALAVELRLDEEGQLRAVASTAGRFVQAGEWPAEAQR